MADEEILEQEEVEEVKYEERSSYGRISSLVSLLFFAFLLAVSFFVFAGNMTLFGMSVVPILFASYILYASFKVNAEWEQAVILKYGKYSRTVGAGIYFIIPIIEQAIVRDMRIRTLKIPKQEVITKDNISILINAVVFFKIDDAKKSVVNIQQFIYAMIQYAQTTLRNVVGQKEMDEILAKREDVAKAVGDIVLEHVKNWGIIINNIELQDIVLPENMKRVMARQAEAERDKRATIIASEGEVIASNNLLKASNTLMKSRGGVAVKLRELRTLENISSDGNSIVFYPTNVGVEKLAAGTSLAANRLRKSKK
jgi:regulator of protease activity HflC (stomatin/prohibitin superfamily)